MDNPGATSTQPQRVIGYYAGWTAQSKGFTPLDIRAGKLTHINYAFGLIDEQNRAMLMDPEADVQRPFPGDSDDPDAVKGNFHQLQLLKERNPHLQTLISMGGWTGSGRFSDACATADTRREFVVSIVELYLTRWPGVFDGVDIDWEYPVCCGLPENSYRPEDLHNCTLLFEELRRQLDDLGRTTGRYYPVTTAIPAGRKLPTTCFELGEIGRICDFINIMTYDLVGAGDGGVTNFHSAFNPAPSYPASPEVRDYHNVVRTVEVFEAEGVPPEKLVVGVPFYGRGFTGVPPENDGLFQPFTGTTGGDYRTIKRNLLPTALVNRHPEAQAPWLYDPNSGTMMVYDDPESLALKREYVQANGLGGLMIWELSDDDEQASLLTALSPGSYA